MTYERMVEDLLSYVAEDPLDRFKLIVGTDSHTRDELCFVSAIIIHRIGKGARYYYRRRSHRKLPSLRQRIFYEAAISLSLAEKLAESLVEAGAAAMGVEIHLDVGEGGDTRELIREVVGMVVGSGFHAEIKPNSYGASKVADKYTK
jgi:uncharacterized protein